MKHLDTNSALSRQIAELSIYPAVDPLDSTSRMLDPRDLKDKQMTLRFVGDWICTFEG